MKTKTNLNDSANQFIETTIKSIAFFTLSGQNALAYLRMLGPARNANIKVMRGLCDDSIINFDAIQVSDLIVIQREFCRDYFAFEKIINLAHSIKKKVIFDIDDHFFELPENHPDKISGYFNEAILPLLLAIIEADLVTVSTEQLRQVLLQYNKNIEVIPNYLDDLLWRIKSTLNFKNKNDPIIIGYMGGHTHKPDLEMVLPALLKLNDDYPGKIIFRFWGIQPPFELQEKCKTDFIELPQTEYIEFADFFQTQTADIFIAPLVDNIFNKCKSPIKFFEYSALGVPGVYSRITPYSDIIQHEKDGLLAETTEEWVDCLRKLVENPEFGLHLISNAQRKICQHWLLSKNIHKRIGIYNDLIQDPKPIESKYFEILPLLKRIAIGNIQREEKDRSKIQTDSITIQNLNDRIKQLEKEVEAYETSNSWRITKPLRIFVSRLGRKKEL